jgi:hypothetical protein
MGGLQSRSERSKEKKIPSHCPLRELNTGRPTRSIVCICLSYPGSSLSVIRYEYSKLSSRRNRDIHPSRIQTSKKDTSGKGVFKRFRTGCLERELQTVQLSATSCSYIAILWVSLVSFATITLCVASQWVFKRVYPKVSGLTAWSENCKWYSSLPLGAVVSLFCESL